MAFVRIARSYVIQPIIALISSAALAGEGRAIVPGMMMAFVNRMALVVWTMADCCLQSGGLPWMH